MIRSLPVVEREVRPNTTEILPLHRYDLVIVACSGGKDSAALALDALERGVRPERLQLWHHLVDGRPGVDPRFMDWAPTASYVRALGAALGVRVLFSWREGGFRAELLKQDARTRSATFERQDGTWATAGGVKGKLGTRRRFPQKTGDMRVRWCSPTLKIDVARLAIANDPALRHARILFLTGERRPESTNRSLYAEQERHACSTRARRVDAWRSLIDWREDRVWDTLRRQGIVPHPAYRLGFPRVSCLTCVFADPDQWASIRLLDPERFETIARLEEEFGCTIDRRWSVRQQADRGTPYPEVSDPALRALGLGEHYPANQIRTEPGAWQLPPGAFKRGGGPS